MKTIRPKFQVIVCAVLGVATLITFFTKETSVKGVFGLTDITHIAIYALFLASTLWLVHEDMPSSGSRLVLPSWTKTMMVLLPTLALVSAVINALFPYVGGVVRMSDNDIFTRPGAIARMIFELVSCGIFISLLPRFIRKKQWLPAIVLGALVLVLFVMGMEEISWGQRVFQWQTSAYFTRHNVQGETNLHNLNTQLFQNALFFGGFILLAVLPFFYNKLTNLLRQIASLKFLTKFLPEPWMLVAFSAGLVFTDPFTAPYGFHWGSICFQLIATFVLLGMYAYRQRQSEQFRMVLWTIACAALVLILSWTHTELWLINQGLPTEYIKLFVNFGILCWAIRVRTRILES